uniref:RxLR effector candidate protein n=1 Tax=Peronospora matthiolae TaxID=2874970 RepID=A0AAV1TGH8_9STRA
MRLSSIFLLATAAAAISSAANSSDPERKVVSPSTTGPSSVQGDVGVADTPAEERAPQPKLKSLGVTTNDEAATQFLRTVADRVDSTQTGNAWEPARDLDRETLMLYMFTHPLSYRQIRTVLQTTGSTRGAQERKLLSQIQNWRKQLLEGWTQDKTVPIKKRWVNARKNRMLSALKNLIQASVGHRMSNDAIDSELETVLIVARQISAFNQAFGTDFTLMNVLPKLNEVVARFAKRLTIAEKKVTGGSEARRLLERHVKKWLGTNKRTQENERTYDEYIKLSTKLQPGDPIVVEAYVDPLVLSEKLPKPHGNVMTKKLDAE